MVFEYVALVEQMTVERYYFKIQLWSNMYFITFVFVIMGLILFIHDQSKNILN